LKFKIGTDRHTRPSHYEIQVLTVQGYYSKKHSPFLYCGYLKLNTHLGEQNLCLNRFGFQETSDYGTQGLNPAVAPREGGGGGRQVSQIQTDLIF